MKNKWFLFRFFMEALVILLLLVSLPWVYDALSCGGTDYYSPDPEIDIDVTISSNVAARPVTNDNKVAAFTDVSVTWKKGRQIGASYYADVDRHFSTEWDNIAGMVEIRLTSGTIIIQDWKSDGIVNNTATDNLFGITGYYESVGLGSVGLTLRARDINHSGTPEDGTDDPSDWVQTTTIEWVTPTAESTSFLNEQLITGPTVWSNTHTYSGVLSHPSNVKFTDLYYIEIVSLETNTCGKNIELSSGNDQIGTNNNIFDTLAMSLEGSDLGMIPGCQVLFKQEVYLDSSSTPSDDAIHLHDNYLDFKFINGGSVSNMETQRRTPTSSSQSTGWQ